MGKRKLSGGEPTPAKEPKAAKEDKQVEEEEDPYAPGPIDFNPLKFLISPQEIDEFTSKYWERKPLHIPADDARKKFFDGLFDFEALAKISDQLEAGVLLLMDKDPGPKGDSLTFDDDVDDEMIRTTGPLMFGRDVVAVRYIDGKRETISGDEADSDTLRTLFTKANATLQLHQPQRFVNGLWRLVAALEAQAGCLVGCNAYVTPKGGQGLAPHHDGVELFVCQTQGTKEWKLYKPTNGFELPSRESEDLNQESLGEPILEVTMKPGDVLYVPRGVVHQAVAQEEGSCHLTVSTYQGWSWGNLAELVVETALEAQGDPKCAVPLALRKGLPLGFIFQHGVQAEKSAADGAAAAAAARPAAASLAAGLRALADQLEAGPTELLGKAADRFALDFLQHRIPPHPAQLPDQGEEPGPQDSIACRGLNLFRLVPVEVSDDEGSDSDEEGDKEDKEAGEKKAFIKLVTCLRNSRFTHMIQEDDDGDDHHGHHHDHEGPYGIGGSDEEDEDEEDEDEEDAEEKAEEEEKKKSGKKAAAEEGAKEEDGAKGKKGGKAVKKEKEEEEEEEEDAEVMELDEEGGDDNSGDEDEEEEDEDEEQEDEEEGVQGPIFPSQYALTLAEVLAATPDRPLPVKALKVPGGDDEEKLRLARLLHEFGFVVTVPAAGKAAEGAKEEEKEGDKEEEEEKKEEEEEKKEKSKKGSGKGEEKEGAVKAAKSEETKGASPPAKKAKKGGK